MRFFQAITCLLACLLFVSCGKTELKKRTKGYKGEALSNPFLAAQRFLEEEGYTVEKIHGVGLLDYQTATLFVPLSSINTEGRSNRLLDWVNNGGHLVLMCQGSEAWRNDFHYPLRSNGGLSLENELEQEGGVKHFFDALELEISSDELVVHDSERAKEIDSRDKWEELDEKDRALLGAEKSQITFLGESLNIYHWANQAFVYPECYEGEYGSGELDETNHRFLSLLYGEGRVSLLGDARPLRNRYISHADHAEFLSELVKLSPRNSGKVTFSMGDGDGLFAMLARHFPLFLIALIVLIILWLWKNLPRFGPEKNLEDKQSRNLLSQVQGIGLFLWRYKKEDAMLRSMRESVRRHFSLQPGASQNAIYEQLAERSGISEQEVIEAMTREDVRDPGVMVRVTKNLQNISNQLI